jgi:hypothetical protein
MSTWLYRTLMTLLVCNFIIGAYALANYKPPQSLCLNGIVMIPDKDGDMWVQKGLWATHCMPVDKD